MDSHAHNGAHTRNVTDMTGAQWERAAADIAAFEEATMTDAERTFRRLVAQHAKGLLTDRDLYVEVVGHILATDPTDLF